MWHLTHRSASGNMLTMTALIGGLLVFICVASFCFYMLVAENGRSQSDADRQAMQFADMLNAKDRVGKVNNIVARNRELVFLSRESANMASVKGMEAWAPLADNLCTEARASQTLVENERLTQINLCKSMLRSAFDLDRKKKGEKTEFILPDWQTGLGEIKGIAVGYVKNIQSNVVNTDVFPALREFDEHERYFQKGSDLYMGNINAKLPPPDNDLDFKFASVAAPVENTIAPSRLVNPEAFRPTGVVIEDGQYIDRKIDQLPSAVQIVRLMPVTMATGDKQTVTETAAALCTGSGPMPEGRK